MTTKRLQKLIASTGLLVLSVMGCADQRPEIKGYKDVTGDGIKDILMYEYAMTYNLRGNYLFIGKEDGTFIRTQEKKDGNVKYFLSEDGVAYFFDGEFYRPSPKQK